MFYFVVLPKFQSSFKFFNSENSTFSRLLNEHKLFPFPSFHTGLRHGGQFIQGLTSGLSLLAFQGFLSSIFIKLCFRFSHLTSLISHLASRFSSLASPILGAGFGSWLLFLISRFSHLTSQITIFSIGTTKIPSAPASRSSSIFSQN